MSKLDNLTLFSAEEESALYKLGLDSLANGDPLPRLSRMQLAIVIRAMWDRAGFIGRNNGGYPVVSLLSDIHPATDIANAIEAVTGRSSPPRLVGGRYWVGVSGRTCVPWLRFLYDNACEVSEARLGQAEQLLREMDT